MSKNTFKKAGFIPYVIVDGEPLFYFMVPSHPKYGGTRPGIAKGNIDPGEDKKTAAIREAEEELGLKKSNIKAETIKKCWAGNVAGVLEEYPMVIYIGEVISKEDFNKPHYETGATHWLTEGEFNKKGKLSHIKIVKKARSMIKG